MTVFAKGAVTIVSCDLLLVALAIPLVLRKIPPNWAYGFRTPATLSDERIWYEANAHFGRGLLVACVVSAALILILYRTELLSPYAFLNVSLGVLVVPTLIAALATQRFVRSLRA